MRKTSINWLVPALLFVTPTFVFGQPPNPMSPKPGPEQRKVTEAPAKSKLEQMLEIALKNNPDLRVAESKALAADAEVSRTRLAVSQKVVLLYNNLEAARATVQLAEKQLVRLQSLLRSGTASVNDLAEVEAKLILAKADLAKLEAEVPYLLGQQNSQDRADGNRARVTLRLSAADAGLTLEDYRKDYNALVLSLQQKNAATVNKSMSEKLHAALEKTIDLKQNGAAVKDLFDEWQDTGKFNIPVILKDGSDVIPKDISFKSVSMGAVLQWLEDSLPDHRFVVRDYGLVLMKRDKVPPDALLLDDFRKEAPKATEEP